MKGWIGLVGWPIVDGFKLSSVSCDSEFTKWQHPTVWYVALEWHVIEFAQTSAILDFYAWFRFRPHHRSQHVILHQSPKFYPNRTTLAEKNDVMSIFKMADLSPFCILATDRQTNKQMDSSDALSRSRYRERRLKKKLSCRREGA